MDAVGAKSVSLTTTGHDKHNVTVALIAAASGAKNGHSLSSRERVKRPRIGR